MVLELEMSSSVEHKSAHQNLCLRLIEQYGREDIGVVFIFLLNILKLKKGEWIFIDANEPHVYIQGQLMENMINSDNVVRGGLTPKLKDVETLCSILPFDGFQKRSVWTANLIKPFVSEYKIDKYPETRVVKVQLPKNERTHLEVDFCGALIVLEGSCNVTV